MTPSPHPVAGGVRLAAALLLFTAVIPAPAHAYIDPMAGSVLLQVVAAGALAAAFTYRRVVNRVQQVGRTLWQRIRAR